MPNQRSCLSEPALRLGYRFALSSGEPVFEIATLRRPEFVLKLTNGHDISVDERLWARAFPSRTDPSRCTAMAIIAGSIRVEGQGIVGPGEAVLLDVAGLSTLSSKNAAFLSLEWNSADRAGNSPSRLARPHRDRLAAIASALLDRDSEQRSTLVSAFALFRDIGAPLSLSVEQLEGEPSRQDHQLARALEEQLENLGSHTAFATPMSDALDVSERHLDRMLEDFSARYGINARNWRDARNRWRVQNAALLLSRPGLTVSAIAGEVGYASANALARAFLRADFPAPAALRQQMSEMDPLP